MFVFCNSNEKDLYHRLRLLRQVATGYMATRSVVVFILLSYIRSFVFEWFLTMVCIKLSISSALWCIIFISCCAKIVHTASYATTKCEGVDSQNDMRFFDRLSRQFIHWLQRESAPDGKAKLAWEFFVRTEFFLPYIYIIIYNCAGSWFI